MSPIQMRPILHSSCAQATTWAEARFRIDGPIEGRRGARVVALDDGAATLVRGLARERWHGARFYTLVARRAGASAHPDPGAEDDMPLHRAPGGSQRDPHRPESNHQQSAHIAPPASEARTRLGDELADADVTVLVATRDGASTEAVTTIGVACARRGIMTAGVVLGEPAGVAGTVRALRPHARVLLVSQDEQDVAELLSALRA